MLLYDFYTLYGIALDASNFILSTDFDNFELQAERV